MRLKKKWIFLLVCLATLLTLYAAPPVYLSALGHLMVVSDSLEKSDAVVEAPGRQQDIAIHLRLSTIPYQV